MAARRRQGVVAAHVDRITALSPLGERLHVAAAGTTGWLAGTCAAINGKFSWPGR